MWAGKLILQKRCPTHHPWTKAPSKLFWAITHESFQAKALQVKQRHRFMRHSPINIFNCAAWSSHESPRALTYAWQRHWIMKFKASLGQWCSEWPHQNIQLPSTWIIDHNYWCVLCARSSKTERVLDGPPFRGCFYCCLRLRRRQIGRKIYSTSTKALSSHHVSRNGFRGSCFGLRICSSIVKRTLTKAEFNFIIRRNHCWCSSMPSDIIFFVLVLSAQFYHFAIAVEREKGRTEGRAEIGAGWK